MKKDNAIVLEKLWSIIQDRRNNPTPASYTCKLLKNRKLLEAKLEEELAELMKSRKKEGKDSTTWETADLLYHLMVYMAARNIGFDKVMLELKGRMR